MRRTALMPAAVTALLVAVLAGCGGSTRSMDQVDSDKFASGTAMATLADAGTIRIAVAADQPGLSSFDPGTRTPRGFEADVARLLVADLDIASSGVRWVPTESAEAAVGLVEQGRVDLAVASIKVDDATRERVGLAGPYLVTGQQLLVRADSVVGQVDTAATSLADLRGRRVCAAEGSPSLVDLHRSPVRAVTAPSYLECARLVLDGALPAMVADGSVLLGLAARAPGTLHVVGEQTSLEGLAIAYPPGRTELCAWAEGVLADAYDDGTWAASYAATLGRTTPGLTPDPPTPLACPS